MWSGPTARLLSDGLRTAGEPCGPSKPTPRPSKLEASTGGGIAPGLVCSTSAEPAGVVITGGTTGAWPCCDAGASSGASVFEGPGGRWRGSLSARSEAGATIDPSCRSPRSLASAPASRDESGGDSSKTEAAWTIAVGSRTGGAGGAVQARQAARVMAITIAERSGGTIVTVRPRSGNASSSGRQYHGPSGGRITRPEEGISTGSPAASRPSPAARRPPPAASRTNESRLVFSDEPDAALVGDIRPGPLDHHENPVAEPDQVQDVDEEPRQPGEPA